MASLASPAPSALASFLSSWLPCGFAVGPSRLCEGRLGLWWVGHSLEAGALLGSEGDAEWAWNDLTTHSQESELPVDSRAVQNNSTEAEKVDWMQNVTCTVQLNCKHDSCLAIVIIMCDTTFLLYEWNMVLGVDGTHHSLTLMPGCL